MLSPFSGQGGWVAAALSPAQMSNSFSPLLVQDSLPEKLAVHEKNVREFDAFVETLQ